MSHTHRKARVGTASQVTLQYPFKKNPDSIDRSRPCKGHQEDAPGKSGVDSDTHLAEANPVSAPIQFFEWSQHASIFRVVTAFFEWSQHAFVGGCARACVLACARVRVWVCGRARARARVCVHARVVVDCGGGGVRGWAQVLHYNTTQQFQKHHDYFDPATDPPENFEKVEMGEWGWGDVGARKYRCWWGGGRAARVWLHRERGRGAASAYLSE